MNMNIWMLFLCILFALHIFVFIKNFLRVGWRKYTFNLLIGLDQFYNCILGGMPDETISSRCGRGYGKRWYWTLLGKLLNVIDKNHIQDALQHEKEHLHQTAGV